MLKVHGTYVHLRDFHNHVGKDRDGYVGLHGEFGCGQKNGDRGRMLGFADSFELKIAHARFRKEVEKQVTYESGGPKTVIDYILV